MRWLIAMIVAVSAALSANPAQANFVYTFAASCGDCVGPSGTPLVTATLTLAAETPGQYTSAGDFVSFSYDGSSKAPAFTILAGGQTSFSALFLDQPSQSAVVFIQGEANDNSNQWVFATDTSGNFNLAVVVPGVAGGEGGVDQGTDATWTAETPVPEAPSLTLLAVGLVAAIAVDRRRRTRRHPTYFPYVATR